MSPKAPAQRAQGPCDGLLPSQRLPDALFICYGVSTLSGLYFFAFALRARIRRQFQVSRGSEDDQNSDQEEPEPQDEPLFSEPELQPQPELETASRRLPAAGAQAAEAPQAPEQFDGAE